MRGKQQEKKNKGKEILSKQVKVLHRQRECVESDLPLCHKISCDGHVLEEDGQVERTVTFSVCDGGICSVPHQLDHHGEVALPHH